MAAIREDKCRPLWNTLSSMMKLKNKHTAVRKYSLGGHFRFSQTHYNAIMHINRIFYILRSKQKYLGVG